MIFSLSSGNCWEEKPLNSPALPLSASCLAITENQCGAGTFCGCRTVGVGLLAVRLQNQGKPVTQNVPVPNLDTLVHCLDVPGSCPRGLGQKDLPTADTQLHCIYLQISQLLFPADPWGNNFFLGKDCFFTRRLFCEATVLSTALTQHSLCVSLVNKPLCER